MPVGERGALWCGGSIVNSLASSHEDSAGPTPWTMGAAHADIRSVEKKETVSAEMCDMELSVDPGSVTAATTLALHGESEDAGAGSEEVSRSYSVSVPSDMGGEMIA
mmetsp:Transcript_41335/g.96564  ORF Transcript_41335/g.96564 Transcript_41335/m.96564 type:complete len:107 (+) Transcript_41335:281-601(+)